MIVHRPIGVCGKVLPGAARRGALASLDYAKSLGLDGIFFRTVLAMSDTLDPGALQEIRQRADELGMYLEGGLGKVNPYASAENPELREIGDGDIVAGFRAMMQACAAIGVTELWISTANYKTKFANRYAYDRFRTDVSWEEQLAATSRFLRKLAPIARDLGVHMNMENHEEITSFETLRLIEDVGPDVLGVVFDSSNMLHRAEHPVAAAERLGPYVRQTHLKDALAAMAPDGRTVEVASCTCGEGVVDFGPILDILLTHNPALNLTLEGDPANEDIPRFARTFKIELGDQDWLAGHPDLTAQETQRYLDMVRAFQSSLRGRETTDWAAHFAKPYRESEAVARIVDSAAHVRSFLPPESGAA